MAWGSITGSSQMASGSRSRADRLRASGEETRRLLERVGYFTLVKKHGHTRPDFTPPPSTAEIHQGGFGLPAPPRRPLPPDAKRYNVGNSHKQGLELITPGSNPADYNGAKK